MKTLIALLLAAAAALAWLRHENANLAQSLSRANNVATEQKRTLENLQHQLQATEQRSGEKEQAQVALREQIDAASVRAQRHEQTITRLLHENEQLHRWYHADLPDAVRRLHRRPACADAGECLQRLPESDPLPDAGKRSTNQW